MKARMIRWTVMAAPWSHIWLCLRWLPKGQNHQNPLQGPALATGDLMGSSAGKNSIRTMTAGFRAQSGRATSKVSTGWMPIRMASSQEELRSAAREFHKKHGSRLRQMDTDADGSISRSEWKGKEEIFNQLDANKDGALTRDELREARRQDRSRSPRPNQGDKTTL